MLRRLLTVTALASILSTQAFTEPQIPAPAGAPSGVIALSTGTAIRLVPKPNIANPIKCNSMLIMPLAGGSALVYVLNANPSITAVKDMDGTTTVAQLAPGTSTSPGQAFTFPSNSTATSSSGGFDLRFWAVQGSTGDSVLATCDVRQ